MSWIARNTLTWLQTLVIKIMKTGQVPKHVAFIMDGNRRYANKTGVKKIEGHTKGFDKLSETLQWCLEFGILEVTVYAFSIENFKRSKEEVEGLMDLAKEKFQTLLDEKDKLMEHGVCVRIIGNLSLVRPDVRKIMAEAMWTTKNNDKAFLNVAFSYTSRDEITCTLKEVVQGVKNGDLLVDDISENLFAECLYTYKSKDPDLLIRTSGEFRLSDFLLWQSSHSCIYFTKVLWPEFSAWDLIKAVFYYQRCYSDIVKLKNECSENVSVFNNRTKNFVEKLHKEKQIMLEDMTSASVAN